MTIKSESQFILKLLLSFLKLPITLIQIVFGKKNINNLFEPFKVLNDFLWETKFTTNIIFINLSIFIITRILQFTGVITEEIFTTYLINHPTDLLQFKIIPIISSWFMHADTSHLLGNMIFLFLLGRVVEKNIGIQKTAIVYFGSALISTIFNSLIYLFIFNSNTPGLGASGAIAGLASAAMLLNPLYLTYLVAGIPLPIFVVSWSFLLSDVMGILSGANDGIGHFAHIGGFLAITILFSLLDREDIEKIKKGIVFNLITIAIFLFLKF